jgi:hypothetical protein
VMLNTPSIWVSTASILLSLLSTARVWMR